jgi:MSHA biogenesis protein MshN
MSLINKMLQDLDARGTPADGPMQVHIKPVAREERRVSLPLVAAAAGGAVLIAAAGAFGWRYLNKPAQKAAVPQRAAIVVVAPPVPMPAPVAVAPAAPMPAPVAVAPAAPLAAAPLPEPVPAAAAKVEEAAVAASRSDEVVASPEAAPHKKTRKERREEKARLAAEKAAEKKAKAAEARRLREEAAREEKAAPAAKSKGTREAFAVEKEAPPAKSKSDRHAAAVEKAVTSKRSRAGAPVLEGREETPAQRAEGAYRSALANLQEGRVGEAIASLQKALQVEPRHDAARQTLVGLLIENKRGEEAMRQLQLGLTLDPRQPALAMLLARLQIERGESGIETLTRTLPYAAGNGEYQALLAGALQRQQRHREAAEQYQAALRTEPRNAVWWMGLGISLQAEKRNAEALDAFQKAKASGSLSAELQGFVERKLGQLGR